MTTGLEIDVAADMVCPWRAVGMAGVDQASATLAGEVEATPAFQLDPFPDLLSARENGPADVARGYDIASDRVRANRIVIGERAAAVGATMVVLQAGRIVVASDAHRLRAEQAWRYRRIDRVTTVIVDDRRRISRAGPLEKFDRQLRVIAAARPDRTDG